MKKAAEKRFRLILSRPEAFSLEERVQAMSIEYDPSRPPKSRKEKIFKAAYDLFERYGYRGTSMNLIAHKAGYSKKSIYLDFRGKDDLFLNIIIYGTNLLLAELLEIPHETLSIKDAIKAFFSTYRKFSLEHKEYFKMGFSEVSPEVLGKAHPKTLQKLTQVSMACMNEAVKVAQRAIDAKVVIPVDPWETAGVFLAAATGNIAFTLGPGQAVFPPQSLESINRNSIDIILRGILSDPDSGREYLV